MNNESKSARAGKATGPGGNTLFVLTLLIVGYMGAIGFCTVWLRHRISVTANSTKSLELQIADVQRRVDGLKADISRAESPAQLLQQNIALGINLVRPREEQVVRTSDDVERRLASKRFNLILGEITPPGRSLAGP